MPLLHSVWDGRVGVGIRKAPTPNHTLLEASPPRAPPGGPAPSPGTPGPGAWAPTGRPNPDLWESSRAQPEAPLSSQGDKPFPRRPAPAPPRAPDSPRGPSRPPPGADSAARPTPGRGAPRGDRLTGARWPTHRVARSFPPRPAPPPDLPAAGLAESGRGRRLPPPARGEPGGQDGEGGRGAHGGGQRRGGECPGEARPGAGGRHGSRGCGPGPSQRASRGLRSRPAPARRGEAAPTSSPTSHARPPPSTIWKSTASESDTSKIPRPLRPPSPSRAAFLPRRFREGERIPRTESAGKDGEGGGGRESPGATAQIFFHQEESTRFFPSSKPRQAWGWGGREGETGGGPEPSKMRPQSGGQPPPGPHVPGVPRRTRGAPAVWRQVFPGKPGAPGALRDERSHSRGLGVRPGLSSARDLAAEAWGPGPLQSPDPARLTFPRAETRGSGRATHQVAHAFPAGSPEDPRCPLRCSRRRRRSPPPPAAAAAQITTRRV